MNVTTANEIMQTPGPFLGDRRSTTRFPLAEDVTYRYRHGKLTGGGAGRCLNIGSGGVLFTTSSRLPIGRTIELSVNWPALLHGSCPLKFIASGPVVRSEDNRAAIRIDRYEFRTRATKPGLAESLSELRTPALSLVYDQRRVSR
jgi:hypothetical protein